MNKEIDELEDELLPKYDFSKMVGGIKGKYVERYRGETNLVLLEPEVAQALRLLIHIARRQHSHNPVGAD